MSEDGNILGARYSGSDSDSATSTGGAILGLLKIIEKRSASTLFSLPLYGLWFQILYERLSWGKRWF